jgi:exopolyphosphatase/guanosine-5'-triphosphate,3'-diphosphate pyrophosphatase
MRIYLLRHARAESRANWDGEDVLRPLSETGREQAVAVADELSGMPPDRIVCDPSLRCQETVQVLARRHRIPVEVDERLAAGETVQRALELLPRDCDESILLCTHSDVVASVLRFFELPAPDPDAAPRCKKGALWLLEGPGRGVARAQYIEPLRRTDRSLPAESGRQSLRSAVLDLGSTSFSLLIADVRKDGILLPVVYEKVMLRLGAVLAKQDTIPDDIADRAIAVARELGEIARREKVENLLTVATSAIRDAKNGRAIARRIERVIGTPVRVLSGKEEARLMFRAFQARLELGRTPALGIDLGGGSLELAVGNEDSISFEATLPIGVARLAREFVTGDPIRKSDVRKLRKRVEKALAPHVRALEGSAIRRAIATGGAVRALDRLVRELSADGTDRLGVASLSELTDELVASGHEDRLAMRGIRKARADLLPTAAVIVSTVADVLCLEEIDVCDWGLREALLLESFDAERPDT